MTQAKIAYDRNKQLYDKDIISYDDTILVMENGTIIESGKHIFC